MNASHDWLRGFVPHTLSPEELGELLSRHVVTLDGLHRLKAELAPFVVGRVMTTEKIPDTKLSFNMVDDGSGTLLEVVCGAPNVMAGRSYPFARTGTRMPAGLVIEKRKIRGFTSNGMLCSSRELGLGEEHDGILELDTTAAPGTPLLEVMPVGDVRLELDVLPNRPDLLSQRGMAREVAAFTGTPLGLPDELRGLAAVPEPVRGASEASSGGATVRLDDAGGCPRYMAVVIRGVTVAPSPAWLAARLQGVGARSIGNVVDVTNYMLHGFGQPMHAFDLKMLAKQTVVVRRARAGETMTTLDGVARTLTDQMTVIADAERAIAVAGVMGAQDSEITPATTDVLLEVAAFDPRRTRATRRALGLSTDASYRFERGIDARALPELLALAAGLIVKVAGGRIDGTPIDVGAAPAELPRVTLAPSRAARVLGVPVSREEIMQRLESIGFRVSVVEPDRLAVEVPAWRHDVTRDVDLIEEIARLRGYDTLPDELRPFRPGTVPNDPLHMATQRVRDALVAAGLFETKALPFVKGDDATHVRVENPLAEDEPHLRTSILETLAKRLEYNLNRGEPDVRLFEVGSVFRRGGDALPVEEVRVAALVTGLRAPRHFSDSATPANVDIWDAKALAEVVVSIAFGDRHITFDVNLEKTGWTLGSDGQQVGVVHRVAVDAGIATDEGLTPSSRAAFGIELLLAPMANAVVAPAGQHLPAHKADAVGEEGAAGALGTGTATRATRYRPVPNTPAAYFDLALVVPDTMTAVVVEGVLRRFAGELLESLALFDEFRGKDVPVGSRSLAWRLTFRHPSRTLKGKEIDGRRSQLLKTLESELGVRPRAQ